MPRKVPQSAKKHRERLLDKRAIKRGDVDPMKASKPDKKRNRFTGPVVPASTEATSARKLQSTHATFSPAFLQQTKVVAANVPLPRPVPATAALYPVSTDRMAPEAEQELDKKLGCMKRPKWRHDMTKGQVEGQEEGEFKKWLARTDSVVEEWLNVANEARESARQAEAVARDPDIPAPEYPIDEMPFSSTTFERNLEVWRQLWRVSELSQIVLVLLDSRCPPLHFPRSLQAFLSTTKCRVILVLTKVDIVGLERAEAWQRELLKRHPTTRVVMVESYTVKQAQDGESTTARKTRHRPHIPQNFKERLVTALRETHEELRQPPDYIKSTPEKLAKWRPRVRRELDWNAILAAGSLRQDNHSADKGKRREQDLQVEADSDSEDFTEPDFLTVGLIGQPNVGKSSLLNALFGTTKVRASKTPGKTKHFQTLFWTNELRLVDCPGLVLPSLAPIELQVLSGILPIARMPAIPLCLFYAGQLLPLEKALGLDHPSSQDIPAGDKRTWRGNASRREAAKTFTWTAMDVLEAYAEKKGWITAQAGRPDANRAGNAILRMLAEGRIAWSFVPPDTDPNTLANLDGQGIWIPREDENPDESESDADVHEDQSDEQSDGDGPSPTLVSEASDDEGAVGAKKPAKVSFSGGRFELLDVDGDNKDGEESEDADRE
ncbi:unnamed protein product [Peniophora sp. CBMAI 1063]|nr:unnamed protein product [Peniophora sp. CBMAI 1063]